MFSVDNSSDVAGGLFLLLVGGLILSVSVAHFAGPIDTTNEYGVRTEPVYGDTEAVDYSDLPQGEQKLLSKAFVSNDQLLSGSNTTVKSDTVYNVSSTIRVVDVRGMALYVAIDGPRRVETEQHNNYDLASTFGLPLGLITILFGATCIGDGLE